MKGRRWVRTRRPSLVAERKAEVLVRAFLIQAYRLRRENGGPASLGRKKPKLSQKRLSSKF